MTASTRHEWQASGTSLNWSDAVTGATKRATTARSQAAIWYVRYAGLTNVFGKRRAPLARRRDQCPVSRIR
jgi:hypothetical protein